MTAIITALAFAIVLACTGFAIRAYPYKQHIREDGINRYMSHNGISLTFLDLTDSQWDYLAKSLAVRSYIIATVIFSVVAALAWLLFRQSAFYICFIAFFVTLITTLFLIVRKAKKRA